MENILEVKNLVKKYPDFAIKNLSFKLPRGKIIGFIGANGSGKTTTIKAILDLIKIEQGTIKIFGKKHTMLTKEDKEEIGVVLDDSFFSHVLNVDDINELMQNFYPNWDEKIYYQYINNYHIPKDKVLKEFSSGMKMKIKVICAMSHHAELLILDEPTNGLDPVFRYEILELFEDFVADKKHSIFISSHITSDLEHIADEIIFINDGKILLDILKEELVENYGVINISLEDFTKYSQKDYDLSLKYKDMYQILVSNKKDFHKKYPDALINKPSIEELMLLFIKGVK